MNEAEGEGYVGISNPLPGVVVPLDMGQYPEGIIVQRGAWFGSITAPSGNDVRVTTIWGLRNASCAAQCCGGISLLMQDIREVQGNYAFITANGTILEQDLKAGETIIVEQNSILGYTGNVRLSVKQSGGLLECCCSGQGCFNTQLTSPGKIWLQSMLNRQIARCGCRSSRPPRRRRRRGQRGAPETQDEMER